MCRVLLIFQTPAFRDSGGGVGDLGSPREAVTLLRLEGIAASAVHRAAALAKVLSPFGTAEILEDAASVAIWSSVRDVAPFAAKGALGAWPVCADCLSAGVRGCVRRGLGARTPAAT